jgi:hypothetical protein
MHGYDYIDIAVDALRNIKHFGATGICKLHYCRSFWKTHLPCNIDTIDAVTTQEMGRKAYATRVDFEMDGILNTDTYYTGRYNDFFGKRRSPWTCRCCRQRIHLLSSWKKTH